MQEHNDSPVDNIGDNEAGSLSEYFDSLADAMTLLPPAGPLADTTPGIDTSQIIHRILVTGSRTWRDKATIANALLQWWLANDRPKAILISGGAQGADQLAEEVWNGQQFEIEQHPADWKSHGKAAGPIRNAEMVKLGASVCLAFIHNESRGATHCARLAVKRGIPTIVYRIDDDPTVVLDSLS